MTNIERLSRTAYGLAEAEARELGIQHGKDAAAISFRWDAHKAHMCLSLARRNDPEWEEFWGAGQSLTEKWDDALRDRLIREELDLSSEMLSDDEISALCSAYEEAFCAAHRAEVFRQAEFHTS